MPDPKSIGDKSSGSFMYLFFFLFFSFFSRYSRSTWPLANVSGKLSNLSMCICPRLIEFFFLCSVLGRGKKNERGHTLDLLRTEQSLFYLSLSIVFFSQRTKQEIIICIDVAGANAERESARAREGEREQWKAIRKEREKEKKKKGTFRRRLRRAFYIYYHAVIQDAGFFSSFFLFLSKRTVWYVVFLNTYIWVCRVFFSAFFLPCCCYDTHV